MASPGGKPRVADGTALRDDYADLDALVLADLPFAAYYLEAEVVPAATVGLSARIPVAWRGVLTIGLSAELPIAWTGTAGPTPPVIPGGGVTVVPRPVRRPWRRTVYGRAGLGIESDGDVTWRPVVPPTPAPEAEPVVLEVVAVVQERRPRDMSAVRAAARWDAIRRHALLAAVLDDEDP